MTLNNLIGLSLDRVASDKHLISRLLAAADRNIADAQLPELSPENRFDVAYKAIMQSAMAALNANGYRTLTSRPGHHQTALQTLPLTIGFPAQAVILLDALRKQRNQTDYSGEPIPEGTAQECLCAAQALLAHLREWLASNRQHLT